MVLIPSSHARSFRLMFLWGSSHLLEPLSFPFGPAPSLFWHCPWLCLALPLILAPCSLCEALALTHLSYPAPPLGHREPPFLISQLLGLHCGSLGCERTWDSSPRVLASGLRGHWPWHLQHMLLVHAVVEDLGRVVSGHAILSPKNIGFGVPLRGLGTWLYPLQWAIFCPLSLEAAPRPVPSSGLGRDPWPVSTSDCALGADGEVAAAVRELGH